jgi:hypothetical protein
MTRNNFLQVGLAETLTFLKGLTDISCDFTEDGQLLLCYSYEHLFVDKGRPFGRRHEVGMAMGLIYGRFVSVLR